MLKQTVTWCGVLLMTGTLFGCRVDVKDPGRAPEVDVTPGVAPDVEVETPDVEVYREERDVTVPDVDVETREERVTVPRADIEFPEDDQP